MNKKKLYLLISAIIVCFIIAEIICQFKLEDFLDHSIQKNIILAQEGLLIEDLQDKLGNPMDLNGLQPKFPHPFFGYTRPLTKDNASLNSEVYGFVERPELLDLKKDNNTVYIGIFGGSVAARSLLYKKDLEYFAEKLKISTPKLQNKKIKILNFSYSGYRQPQQFILFSFFLDKLDYAINLDGANELSGKLAPHFPQYFPTLMASRLYFSGNTFSSKIKQAETFKAYLLVNKINSYLKENQIIFSTVRSFLKSFNIYLWKKIEIDLLQQEKDVDSFWALPDQKSMMIKNIEIWSNFVRRQAALSKAFGVNTIFVIQPLPFSKVKKLSIEESQFIQQLPSEQLLYFQSGYALMQNEVSTLRNMGISIYDANSIYANTIDSVFIDACCHLNQKGTQLLLDGVANHLSNVINSER